MAPALATDGKASVRGEHGGAAGGRIHSSKNSRLYAMGRSSIADALPLEGVYALVPLIESDTLYDVLHGSGTAYAFFKQILHTVFSTDSVDV